MTLQPAARPSCCPPPPPSPHRPCSRRPTGLPQQADPHRRALPAGGSSDIIARAISNLLSESLKQSVVVDNKPGANGNLGADLVAKSAPDGYTMLLCDVGALAITPSVYTEAAVRSRRRTCAA